MKKIILSAAFAVVAISNLLAQVCVPNPQYTVFGVYPGQDTLDIGVAPNGIHSPLPCGVVGQPYTPTTFTAVIPTTVPVGATTLNICNVQLVSMGTIVGAQTGQPFIAGLAYATVPTNGIFNAGTSGCAKITGTPTVAAMNDIEIYTKVKINLGAGCGLGITRDQHFPSRSGETLTTKGRYVLTVLPAGSNAVTDCPNYVATTEVAEARMKVAVAPNPTSGRTIIRVASLDNTTATFKVSDVYGQNIVTQKVVLENIENNIIEFDGSKLAAGAYYFSIDNGKGIFSDKIIVQH